MTKKLSAEEIRLRAVADAEKESQYIAGVAEILRNMKPLGKQATILLTPSGYNLAHYRTREIRFGPEHEKSGSVLFIPKEELEQVTVSHSAEIVRGDVRKVYYWDGKNRLLDKQRTVSTSALGLVINKPRRS